MKPTEMQPREEAKVIWHKRQHRKKRRAAVIVLLVFAAIVGIGVSTFYIVRQVGKSALYKKTASASMNMVREETLDDYDPEAVKYQGEIYHYNKDIITFLVMGIDKSDPVNRNITGNINHHEGGQADALFLVSANPHSKKIFVIGINRNTLAPIEMYSQSGQYLTTQMEPISLQHGFGTGLEDSCERQVKAVSELFYKLPISGYVAINMGVFSEINDAVGGVELPLLEKIPKGSATLNQPVGTMVLLKGRDAFDYVHGRNPEEFNSASNRLERQKQYINAFIPKAMAQVKANPSFVVDLYNMVSKYMVTDVSLSQAVYLATEMIGYTVDPEIYSLKGEMVMDLDGFEKYHIDDDALYDLIMELYYEKVE